MHAVCGFVRCPFEITCYVLSARRKTLLITQLSSSKHHPTWPICSVLHTENNSKDNKMNVRAHLIFIFLSVTSLQWRRHIWGTGARAPPSRLPKFYLCSLWSKSESQLSNYCVVCEISWCRCQQLTALSISTALVTRPLVIDQLLYPALQSTVSAPWPNFQLIAPPRNKSWRRHCQSCSREFLTFCVDPILAL